MKKITAQINSLSALYDSCCQPHMVTSLEQLREIVALSIGATQKALSVLEENQTKLVFPAHQVFDPEMNG